MRKSIVLLLGLSAVLVSCGTRGGSSAIPVEDAQSKHFLDDFTGGRTYLMLDDSSLDAYVNEIEKVQIDDGKLFVMYHPASNDFIYDEEEVISVFDMNGRFLNKIGRRGRGRNEYENINAWCLDTRRNEVLILTGGLRVIKRYTYEGDFVSQVSIEGFINLSNILFCGDKLYGYLFMPNKVADDLIEIKEDGTYIPVMDSRPIMHEMGPFENVGGCIAPPWSLFNPEMGSFYHLRVFDDVLYRIHGDQIQQCGKFDFIKYVTEKDEDYYSSRELLNSRPLMSIETTDKFVIKTREVNSDDMVSGYVYYVYDKSTQKCKRYTSGYDRNVGTIINNFDIVGITGDIIITRATPEGARYILENAADKVPQSDLEMLKALARRENEALIFHRP